MFNPRNNAFIDWFFKRIISCLTTGKWRKHLGRCSEWIPVWKWNRIELGPIRSANAEMGMIQRVESGQFLRDEISRLSCVNRTIYPIIRSYLFRLLANFGSDYWLISDPIIGYYLVRFLDNIGADCWLILRPIIGYNLVRWWDNIGSDYWQTSVPIIG